MVFSSAFFLLALAVALFCCQSSTTEQVPAVPILVALAVLLSSISHFWRKGGLGASSSKSLHLSEGSQTSVPGATAASVTSSSSHGPPSPSTCRIARAISDAMQRKDEAFMRQVFNRHAPEGKLSVAALIPALKDVDAPVLAAASSEGCADAAEYILRRAEASTSGIVDFSE
jgi:hypothetical protein